MPAYSATRPLVQNSFLIDIHRHTKVGQPTISESESGLLVTCQIDNTSPGGGPGGKSVPGSLKRCKLGHTIIRHFSTGDQRIREVIPVPDSLWKETTCTFVCFFAS